MIPTAEMSPTLLTDLRTICSAMTPMASASASQAPEVAKVTGRGIDAPVEAGSIVLIVLASKKPNNQASRTASSRQDDHDLGRVDDGGEHDQADPERTRTPARAARPVTAAP